MKVLQSSSLKKTTYFPFKGCCLFVVKSFAILLLLIFIAFGALYIRLSTGPVDIGKSSQSIVSHLEEMLYPGWTLSFEEATLALNQHMPALSIDGLVIKNAEGISVLYSRQASIEISFFSALLGRIELRSLELDGVHLRLLADESGKLSLLAASEEDGGAIPDDTPLDYAKLAFLFSRDNAQKNETYLATYIRQAFKQVLMKGNVLQSLASAEIKDARLVVETAERENSARIWTLQATLKRLSSRQKQIEVSVAGEGGKWLLKGEVGRSDIQDYYAELAVEQAPIEDIILFGNISSIPLTARLNTSGKLIVRMEQDQLKTLKLELDGHSGSVLIHDKDATVIPIDELHFESSWSEMETAIIIDDFSARSGKSELAFGGLVLFTVPDAKAKVQLYGKHFLLEGLTEQEPFIRLDRMDATLFLREQVELSELIIKGPDVEAEMHAVYGRSDDPKALTLSLDVHNSNGRAVMRLWPEITASALRRFLIEHVPSAHVNSLQVNLDFSGEVIRNARAKKGFPAESMDIRYDVSSGHFMIAEGLPILESVNVKGSSNGTDASMEATGLVPLKGISKNLFIRNGHISIGHYWKPDTSARVSFDVNGDFEAVDAFLRKPAFKDYMLIPYAPDQVSGQTDLKVQLSIPTKGELNFLEIPLQLSGHVSDFNFKDAFSTLGFEKGLLNVFYKNGTLSVKGQGSLADAPVGIEVLYNKEKGGRRTVHAEFTDAVRKKLGFDVGDKLNGVVKLKAVTVFDEDQVDLVEIDFTKSSVNQLLPGWSKRAGKTGKASFSVRTDPEGNIAVEHINADAGSLQLKGGVELSSEFQLKKADFPVFRLAPGDNMSVKLEENNAVPALSVNGNTADLRGLINFLLKKNSGGTGEAVSGGGGALAISADNVLKSLTGSDLDADIKLNIATGFSGEVLTKVDFKTSIRKNLPRRLSFTAMLGSSTVAAFSSMRDGSAAITLRSEDAGRLMRYVDLYPRAHGGLLHVTGILDPAWNYQGTFSAENFTVRNESALKKLIPTQSYAANQSGNRPLSRNETVDINQVVFKRANAQLFKHDQRLKIKDGVIWGEQVGFTFSGNLDLKKSSLEFDGTYIPAYGLNNAIANVPLIGLILGGGSNEGLLGVNFRVLGTLEQPVLSVSPLSAITPGILRKLVGEIEKGSSAP